MRIREHNTIKIPSITYGIFIVFTFVSLCTAQSASDYFVSTTGMEWKYNYYQLDSMQNPIVPIIPTYIVERLIGQSPILSKDVFLFSSKQLTGEIETSRPDTIEIETFPKPFSRYFRFFAIIETPPLDTLGLSLNKYSGWYRTMNLFATINKTDTLFRLDTTFTFDTLSLPLQFLFTTTKKINRTISVPAGIFDCIPFDVRFRLNIMYSVPLFGTIPIPLLDVTDTTYIAKGKWIVKETRCSTTFPVPSAYSALLPLSIPTFNIPGYVKELTQMNVTSVKNKSEAPLDFFLEQNFPNPFNPVTVINYQLPVNSFVSLKVYDINGREITILENAVKEAGKYSIQYSVPHLASGVYFYKLTAGNFSQTRKFIVLK